MSVYVYGASDDLIEIRGDIDEEFNVYDTDPSYWLGFSDGTTLKVNYDGDWNINAYHVIDYGTHVPSYIHVHRAGTWDPIEYPDVPDYSDLVVIDHDINWVIGGKDFAK